MMQQLADGADDVLDELDYFRIQDKLNNTHDAADNHPGGCIHSIGLHVRHTARFVANKFKLSSCLCDASARTLHNQEDDDAKQRCLSFVCTSGSSKAPLDDGQKMKFNRVEMSKQMKHIVHQLDPVCAQVKEILDLELRKPAQGIAGDRPKTTPAIIEPKLFGREAGKKDIVDGITHGKYCADGLTVLPIVGPGGIGKTTFTQHVYQEVKSSFDVYIWVCVSVSFDAAKLVQEIVERVPDVVGERKNATAEELIEQRLKHQRFLLVLDDVWICQEDEWNKLLAPFRNGETRGNMVIVTTRIPETATMVKTTDFLIDLNRLETEDCLHLFEAYVFGHQQSWENYPGLLNVGRKIVAKLKGFPLTAKTVGRLLRNQLTLDHWTRVLESKEWEFQKGVNDIMPALKLSYDYLPFHLQQCFLYCGLFPEDYEFYSKELIHLWIGLDILNSCDQRKTPEDVGQCYLNDLVNLGFLKKNEKDDGSLCYVVHDLLHELAVNVSSAECLSISSSNVRDVQNSLYVRHLSIIIDEKDVNDRVAFDEFNSDLCALQKKLKVEYLQTVMLFGKFHGSFARTFGNLFAEAKAIRVILLSEASYSYILEDVFRGLSKFVHLRYLRITAGHYAKLCLKSNISRFYHLQILDVQQRNVHPAFLRESNYPVVSVQKVSKHVKLRHFLVHQDSGFELKHIGQLEELGGSLRIRNIENVKQKEEANEAHLIHKNHLEKLILQWGIYEENMDSVQEYVLESLKPNTNLLDLHIEGHKGVACPSWLGGNLSVENLESLHLHDIGWKTLPPLGELWFVGDLGEENQSCISGQSFGNLKRLELVKIPRLRKWAENSTCHLCSQLEVLVVKDCPELVELPFTHCQPEKEVAIMTCFPRLQELEIMDCPKLLSLPPIPWTLAPCSAKIERAGSGLEELFFLRKGGRTLGLEECYYSKKHNYYSSRIPELNVWITGKGGQDGMFWNVLAFSNLADLKELTIEDCPPLPLDHLKNLISLKSLEIDYSGNSNVLSPADSESDVIYRLPIERLKIGYSGAHEKELTQLLSHFQDLRVLEIRGCEKLTRVGLVEQQQTTTRGEEEIAAGGEGGLLLSSSHLQRLRISGCRDLSLLSSSLQELHSLRSLQIFSSLQDGKQWPVLGHCSLTELSMFGAENAFAGFVPPPTHDKEPTSCKISKVETNDLTGFLAVPICSLLSSSITCLDFNSVSELECFTKEQDDALQLLISLQELEFHHFDKLQCLPAGLQRLSSLKELMIEGCDGLKSLPKGGLPSTLQNLRINCCDAFISLPKDSLPCSLRLLSVTSCPSLESLPMDSLPSSLQDLRIGTCVALKSLTDGGLPSSLQDLTIQYCPALKSLPDGDLPSSLRVIDLKYGGNSEELMRQCRKLKGTIPIIRD
ncbi:hypothetical protein ACQJBY_067495 [Aegilops geniculata]